MKNPPKDEHVRRATAHQHGGAGVHKQKRRDAEDWMKDDDGWVSVFDLYGYEL